MKKLLFVALLPFLSLHLHAAVLFSQPHDLSGGFIQSSWWEPNGSDFDQYVWDSFASGTDRAVTEITWRGGFDPNKSGSGGPVIDFALKIFASTAGGTIPDIVAGALVEYSTGGNANQTLAGVFAGVTNYNYRFTLPTSFQAAAGVKYWVQITAAQHGIPDWGVAVGVGADGKHVILTPGTHQYLPAANDFAFALVAPGAGHTITTSASPGNSGATSGDDTFASNAVATVVAVPNAGYSFVNWTENGTPVSTAAAYSFTVTSNRTLVANFTSTCTIQVSATTGGTASGSGTYSIGTNVTVRATPNAGYGFVNWTQGGVEVSTATNYTFIASSNRTLVANFVRVWTITTQASPPEGGMTSGDGIYRQGSNFTIVATANPGYAFVNWTISGTPISTNASFTTTAIGNRTFVANFSPLPYTITVSALPANGGTVSGGGTFPSGTSVTLTATTNAGFAFVNWTENGTPVSTSASFSFPATADRTLVANFTPLYTITASALPANGGTVSGGGTFPSGTSVTLTATTNAGFAFVNWTENGTPVSSSVSFSFAAAADRTLVANFTSLYTITASALPANGGTVSGGGTFTSGTMVTLTATTNAGFAFVDWTENGTPVSSSASFSFPATADRTLVANFTPLYTITTSALPPNGGTVSGGGTFTSGTSVTLTAATNAGFAFVNWTENGTPVSTSASFSIPATADRTLVANFTPLYTIAVSALPANG
ncbi:MAG: hypothetical protein HZA90_06370, partial [Verrucomicrobia bacterium]|nr:hypothetical protein [Verrucomicrobiota bacterium]